MLSAYLEHPSIRGLERTFGINRLTGKDSGETAHVEHSNNMLRQRLGRFARKTLSFSNIEKNHEASLKFFIHQYNIAALSEYLSG